MLLYTSCVWRNRTQQRSKELQSQLAAKLLVVCCRTIILCMNTILWKQAFNDCITQRIALLVPWQINSNATLKIQKEISESEENTKKSHHRWWIKTSSKYFQRKYLNRKAIVRSFPIANVSNDLAIKLLNMRVWSWLRMNAGGVLNTCKSNGVYMWAWSACTKQSFVNLVADGWVTRG